MPHYVTSKKPLFLLFGFYSHQSAEAAALPTKLLNATEVTDYRKELMLSLSFAKVLAAKSISKHSRTKKISMIDILTLTSSENEIGY